MQEFAAISVSTYDPDSLVAQLNERSADGWSVVSIVPTGSTITAYLSRAASGDAPDADAPDDTAAALDGDTAPAADGGDGWAASTAAAAAVTAEAASEPMLPSNDPEPTPAVAEPAAQPEPTPAVAPAAEPAAAATAAAAPAGWYADPSSRFELRYWDGSTWTEHVSRGGQQFTDPPVA